MCRHQVLTDEMWAGPIEFEQHHRQATTTAAIPDVA
jgi:hypothetical protein